MQEVFVLFFRILISIYSQINIWDIYYWKLHSIFLLINLCTRNHFSRITTHNENTFLLFNTNLYQPCPKRVTPNENFRWSFTLYNPFYNCDRVFHYTFFIRRHRRWITKTCSKWSVVVIFNEVKQRNLNFEVEKDTYFDSRTQRRENRFLAKFCTNRFDGCFLYHLNFRGRIQ